MNAKTVIVIGIAIAVAGLAVLWLSGGSAGVAQRAETWEGVCVGQIVLAGQTVDVDGVERPFVSEQTFEYEVELTLTQPLLGSSRAILEVRQAGTQSARIVEAEPVIDGNTLRLASESVDDVRLSGPDAGDAIRVLRTVNLEASLMDGAWVGRGTLGTFLLDASGDRTVVQGAQGRAAYLGDTIDLPEIRLKRIP